jgi:dTDP-4-dehydrorhamnose 3,5-epimerase
MKIIATQIADVLLLEPHVFEDERGFFFESYNSREFAAAVGFEPNFVQDNHSRSRKNVVRGLHYQVEHAQGKLVRVSIGEVFDVAVDIRKRSPTFGRWVGHVLSAENRKQLWIPAGFAHGFVVLSEYAEMLYKATDYWAPSHERCIVWDDRSIGIRWPIEGEPIISDKDRLGRSLDDADTY